MNDNQHLKNAIAAANPQLNTVQRHSVYGTAHQSPNRIVVHAMGEYILSEDGRGYDYAPDFLERMQLSAHALVTSDGTVLRCRNDDEGAYHARGFNAGSLGMELLVSGKHDYDSFLRTIKHPYVTDAQYAAAVMQCREWVRLYRITLIDRHSVVSPGRKFDPGAGFPWGKFLDDVRR